MSQQMNSIGANFTETSTKPLFGLGTTHKGADGKEYIYVRAATALTGEGYVAVISPTNTADMITNTTGLRGLMVGVPRVAFAANDYGWLQIKGPANVRVSASCLANVKITTTVTAGELDDAAGTGTKDILGIVLTTANGGAGAVAAGMLVYPSVGATN